MMEHSPASRELWLERLRLWRRVVGFTFLLIVECYASYNYIGSLWFGFVAWASCLFLYYTFYFLWNT